MVFPAEQGLAGVALQFIAAGTSDEVVIAAVPAQIVVAVAAVQEIVTMVLDVESPRSILIPQQNVVARTTVHPVAEGSTNQLVMPLAAVEQVRPHQDVLEEVLPHQDGIIPAVETVAYDVVIAGSSIEMITAITTVDQVVPGAAVNHVIAVGQLFWSDRFVRKGEVPIQIEATSADPIVSVTSKNRVSSRDAEEPIISITAKDHIIT
jgi:hypothetical protein